MELNDIVDKSVDLSEGALNYSDATYRNPYLRFYHVEFVAFGMKNH